MLQRTVNASCAESCPQTTRSKVQGRRLLRCKAAAGVWTSEDDIQIAKASYGFLGKFRMSFLRTQSALCRDMTGNAFSMSVCTAVLNAGLLKMADHS